MITRLIRILTVCGAGVGSCIIIKMSVDKALENLGLKEGKDFETIVTGVPEARSMDFDICITQGTFSNDLKEYAKENGKNWKIIDVVNLISVDEIQKKLLPVLKELGK